MAAYTGCRFCQGSRAGGCMNCEQERANDEREIHGPKDPATINVHLSDSRDVEAVRRQIMQRTGEEPVICMHLYASSLDELRDMLKIEPPEDTRRMSALEKLLESRPGRAGAPAMPVESDELQRARATLAEWEGRTTSYAAEKRTEWRREIARLEAERDGTGVPEDHTQDTDDEEHAEDREAASPVSGKTSHESPPKKPRKPKT